MNSAALIKRFTIDQWSAIDMEYREPDAKESRLKGMGVFLLVALLLTIRRYYGRAGTFRAIFGSMVSNWPFPDLWSYLYRSFSALVLYFIIPAFFIHFVFHERLRDHGLSLKGFAR